MSASIGLRTREIGVRRALGATEAMATRMLLIQGARQLGVGTLIAAPVLLAIGVAATRLFPLGGALTAAAGVLVSGCDRRDGAGDDLAADATRPQRAAARCDLEGVIAATSRPAFVGFGPVHVQPWISQPPAPFLRATVICDTARIATPFCVKV